LVHLDDTRSSVQFSPDSQNLYAISRWHPLQYWKLDRLDNGAKRPPCIKSWKNLPQKKGHWQMHFDGESAIQRLVQKGDRHVEIWTPTKPLKQTLGGDNDRPTSLAISHDGQHIALGNRNQPVVTIWSREGTKVLTLEGHRREVRYLCFANNDTLASVSTDNTINIWNLQSCNTLVTIKAHDRSINRIVFSPDGSTLASASDDGTVKIWHLNFSMLASEGVELATLQVGEGVSSLGFSGKTLVTGDYAGQLQFWKDGTLQHSLQAHGEGITHLAISPDGTQLVTSSYDHTIKRWSMEGKALATIRAHRARVDTVAWHPSGHTLASASDDGTTKLLALDGREITTLHNCCCPKITLLTEDPSDGVYPPKKSSKKLTHHHYRSHLTTLAFTPDGKTLVDAFSCGKTRCWNLDLENLLSRGKAWLGSDNTL
ncbi:MAG: WD40 repeat domain-containing protein, partial [Cyanobacteria bacterium P01_F01_bin.13]